MHDFEPPLAAPRNGAAAAAGGQLPKLDTGPAIDVPPSRPLADLPGLSGNAAADDWDDLLSAVTQRLRQAVGEWPAATVATQVSNRPDSEARLQVIVLECVGALDQLHRTLSNEFGRRHRLELAGFDARAEVAQDRFVHDHPDNEATRLRQRTVHDSRQLLPDSGQFLKRLRSALAFAERQRGEVAVMTLDIAGLPQVAAEHGQAVRGELLGIVAARLRKAVRADDMVSHLGGDEFAFLFADGASREQMRQLACKLFDLVSAPLKVGPVELTVHPSIGIAVSPADGIAAAGLLRSAGSAMRRAKKQQIGYAFFDDRGNTWMPERI